MNTVKLELLFEAYRAYLKERPPDYEFWIGGYALRMGLKDIRDCKANDEKARYFLNAAEEAARLMPSWDWSLLSVLGNLPPKLVLSDVYSFVELNIHKESIERKKLQSSVRHITVLANRRNLPVPSEKTIVETICLLRSLNLPMYRFPFIADIVDRVANFLECELSGPTDDYLGIGCCEQFCEELRDAMKAAFEESLRASNKDRLKASSDKQWQDSSYVLLTGHMLKVIRDADLLSKVATMKTDFSVLAKYALYGSLWESAEKALELTQPEAEFFLQEQAFIHDAFSAGNTVRHRVYGNGIVRAQEGCYVTVDFPDMEQKQFEFLPAVLDETLSVDSDEFQERLCFSRDTLIARETLVEIYEKALALKRELSSGLPPFPRLLELRPVTVDPEALRLPMGKLISNTIARLQARPEQ